MRTETTTALLDGLMNESGGEAWREFDARYRPIIMSFAVALGLSDADAADVSQETLTRFVKSYRAGKYDRSRGRLHAWLVGIARHCISDLKYEHVKRREKHGLSAIADLSDDDHLDKIWEAQYQRSILRRGFRELRSATRMEPKVIRAFEMMAVDHKSPAEVARDNDMTLNDVYLAKHRCLKQLREILARVRESYDFT